MTIVDIDEHDIMRFKEVSDSSSNGEEIESDNILDSVRNTESSEVGLYFNKIFWGISINFNDLETNPWQ